MSNSWRSAHAQLSLSMCRMQIVSCCSLTNDNHMYLVLLLSLVVRRVNTARVQSIYGVYSFGHPLLSSWHYCMRTGQQHVLGECIWRKLHNYSIAHWLISQSIQTCGTLIIVWMWCWCFISSVHRYVASIIRLCLSFDLQLEQQCSELKTELSAVKQHLSSVQQSHAELQRNFLTLYRVACQILAQRDAEIRRINSRSYHLLYYCHQCRWIIQYNSIQYEHSPLWECSARVARFFGKS